MSPYERSFMEGTRGTMAVDWEERIDVRRLREEQARRSGRPDPLAEFRERLEDIKET